MIRHIVFFTAKRPEDRDNIREGLSVLKDIPHSLRLEIAENIATDPIPGPSPDVVVYGEFEDEAQMALYKAHPLYQKSIARVRPLREMRVAADFVSN
ncbi:Dabb family protein [Aliiroseovarius sp. 2305UL8-7]|uniref:Dabb family protein n=1 Tax=Aliiroseovarius conchicola TaxID=3121637 RepID=UPI003529B82B